VANRFFNPNEQFCDSAGLPYAGGTLDFYSSGTSTRLNTLAMTNQPKGRILMASKSKPELKTKATKKPTSSKEDAGVGRRAELLDHERAVGRPITYAGDRYPMQSAPDHGPHK
jgi:hypothetical protein